MQPKLVFLALGTILPLALNAPDKGLEDAVNIQPIPRAQRQIEAAVEKFARSETTDAERLGAVGALLPLKKDLLQGEFFRQLFYYFCTIDRADNDAEAKQLAVVAMIHYLVISPTDVARTVSPYLYSENERLDQIARHFLGVVQQEPLDENCGNNYSHFRPLINPGNPPLPLIRYLYRRSPSSAVLLMRERFSKKPDDFREVLWAEHVVRGALWKKVHGFSEPDSAFSEALAELDQLSKHDQWWVRLYVAEIVRRNREFQTQELLRRLRQDDHPLVPLALSRDETKPKTKEDPPSLPPAQPGPP